MGVIRIIYFIVQQCLECDTTIGCRLFTVIAACCKQQHTQIYGGDNIYYSFHLKNR